MTRCLRCVIVLIVVCSTLAHAKTRKPLRIFFIDVEGGQSTLIVAPSGKSVLIDTGFPGSRDAGRIRAAARAAHIKRLDYVLITHYHEDHVGGVPYLLKKMKVGIFVDHGSEPRRFRLNSAELCRLRKGD